MKAVTINGVQYLGTLTTNEDGSLLLTKAMKCSYLDKSTFADYIQAKNLGDLTEIPFGGTGSQYFVEKLTKDQKLDLKVCKLNMVRAKVLAAPRAENAAFREILGKR
jgi:hypothetical protein